MAEEDLSQEKTEEPTPKRLEEARKEGQIARSRELSTAVLLIGGTVAVWLWYGNLASGLSRSMRESFTPTREEIFDPSAMILILQRNIDDVAYTTLPLLAALFILGVAGPMLLGGWGFSAKALAPKLDRINPLKGLKRMFSVNSVMELFKAIGKVILVGTIAWFCLNYFSADLLLMERLGVRDAIVAASTDIGTATILISLGMLLIAAIDVPFQIQQHVKKLRMTMQQVKDEMKETEGRPEVKGRIRQLQREFARARMMSDIPDADVVITNPTHYSVALKYASESSSAPIVVAKGVDLIAMKIREVANANGVELVEVPALARSLYFTTEIGEQIPDKLFLAVAQVLAYVFQIKNTLIGKQAKLGEIEIPEELQYD
ncbi:MAG: flagellar biosynthesis protein FlhB [Pseudomonadales bacterium]